MKKISSDSISELIKPAEKARETVIQQGRIAVISWLGLKHKSSGRIRQHLQHEGFSAEEICWIMASLQEDGTVDDRSFAHSKIRQRRARILESMASMRQHLIQLGIDSAVVEETLPADWQDETAAELLLQQKFSRQADEIRHRINEGEDATAQDEYRRTAAKAARFLLNRGFDEALVERTVRMVFPGIDSEA